MRAQPRVGDWGPQKVPTTRAKKWQRVLVPIIAVLLAVGVFFLGRMFYLALTEPQSAAQAIHAAHHGPPTAGQGEWVSPG